MIIDFHNHYYPPEYLNAVKSGPARVRLDYGATGTRGCTIPAITTSSCLAIAISISAKACCASTASTSRC